MQSATKNDFYIEIAGEELVASKEKALIWPKNATLFIADAHFGKAALFRASHLPIPRGSTGANLGRLDRLILQYAIEKIVFLGDTWHSHHVAAENTLKSIRSWRETHRSVEMMAILGNHDALATNAVQQCGFTVIEEDMVMDPFVLRHHPSISNKGYVLCGHLHPGVRLRGKAKEQLCLPCFFFRPSYGVLPAFGVFTGLAIVKPTAEDRILLIAGDAIVGG